ncbi:glycosyl hydrolase family 28-related protein [Paenibacillus sp. YN15]|uniref:glycosyl hydrolase family 28-related protein n=1 Tax=Paenibacillus sp. YN15 TaxID=1742774 RepID=UPI0015ECB89B|nr:glycosyl hydrolase family 28-related protein [Paenibacillus sp. YN15]
MQVTRKAGMLLLVLSLLLGGFSLPDAVKAAETVHAVYISSDTETQGNWVGVYGAEGYVLPFYSTTRTTSGRDDPLAEDVADLPDYVSSYSRSGAVSYWVESQQPDVRALQTPDRIGRKKITVYAGTNFTYSFQLSDSEPHLFTVYTTDFGSSETVAERFEILDSGNRVLEAVDVDTINGGKYVTFQVRGSFKFKATKLSGLRTYALGYFFDAAVPNRISNVSAHNLPRRQVGINWEDPAAGETVVLRKGQGEGEFTRIAQTGQGVWSYTDTDLAPGAVYEYALQTVGSHGKLLSAPTAPVSIQIPQYEETRLSFSSVSYTVYEPGLPVTLAVYLTDGGGAPLAGRTVHFLLQGDYVGTYVEPDMGSSATGADGAAQLVYTSPYAGSYTVVAAVPPDDAQFRNGAEAEAGLTVRDKAWESAPVILRSSDGVKPGDLFSISGHGMQAGEEGQLQIAAEPWGTAGQLPSEQALLLDIVQQDDLREQFLQTLLPESAAPGVYRLWVKNGYGWSPPVELNAPRPLFISEYEVFEGLFIDLSGRNLMAAEFGVSGVTKVRLANGAGAAWDVQITEQSPYSLRFGISSGVPLGTYHVEVSNDGGLTWHGLQSGQELTVLPKGEDPLGLGVAWAANFNWSQQFNATDYGAVADDGEDDTDAIAAAIQAAKQAGGGVVRFPTGSFHATVIQMPSRIVLMGAGAEETLLYHIGGKQNFIQAAGDGKTEGRTGIARLGIRAADENMYPDAFIWLGQDWGSAVNDLSLRTASEIFAFETSLEYPVLEPVDTAGGSGRGQGMLVVGKERFLYKNNRAVGWAAQYNRIYINQYALSSGNYAEYSFSQMPITGDYTFIRDNEFVIRGEADVEVHGIGVKSNSHVENNIVRTTGKDQKTTYHNDGESIFLEMPGAYFATGNVLGATANSIALAPVQPLPLPITLRNGRLAVIIVDGTGLGQYRNVEFAGGTTYALEQAWDVIPDSTSKFSLIAPNDNVTIYRNQTIDGQRGIWLYGNVLDAAVADNKLVNTDGIYIASTAVISANRYTPTHFINVRGNLLLGTPGDGHASGIIAVSQRNGVAGRYYASGINGVEIRDNYLYGSQIPTSTPRHQKYSGIVSSAATLSSDSSPVFTPEDRDNVNVIMENNRLEHMLEGLYLMSGLYGHTARGNQFADVLHPVYEKYGEGTARLLMLPDPFRDQRAPFWPALSKLNAEPANEGKVRLVWAEAADNVDVAQYKIYRNGVHLATVEQGQTEYETVSLEADTLHHFRVTALDAAGNESFTYIGAAVKTPAVPSAPAGGAGG